jgi:CO/xanthine dehydrogenase FAD-binding subunit
MIVDYLRPKNISETLKLLDKQDLNPVLMGGGTAIDRFTIEPVTIIDLQELDLGGIREKGNFLEIGATTTLQSLYENQHTPEVLRNLIQLEATSNLRQIATVAGTMVASTGRSAFTAALMALDAVVTLLPGDEIVNLGDMLLMRDGKISSKIITKINIPLNVKLAYQSVSRTPRDLPILSVVIALWPSGRTRVILGGFGASPLLASDGPEPGGEESAVKDAAMHSKDEWASSEYRMEVAPILVKRCFSLIGS